MAPIAICPGELSLPLACTTTTPDPPFTSYIQISRAVPYPFGFRRETKIYRPSRVQVGEVNMVSTSLVSRFAPDPSAREIQTLSAPERSLTYAICLPSGEKRGWLSNENPEVMGIAFPPLMLYVSSSTAKSTTINSTPLESS